MSAVSIRTYAEPQDTVAVQALIGEVQDHEAAVETTRRPWAESRAEYWPWLKAQMANRGTMLVAEQAGKLVGFCACWVVEDKYLGLKPSEWVKGNVGDLIVTKAARGQGVAVELMKAAENYFRHIGIKIVKLSALSKNTDAHKFYETYGMKPYLVTYRKELAEAAE